MRGRVGARVAEIRYRVRVVGTSSKLAAGIALAALTWLAPAAAQAGDATHWAFLPPRSASPDAAGAAFTLPPTGLVMDDLECDVLRQALERTNGNHNRAARLLGMTRDQIRYRIDKFGF